MSEESRIVKGQLITETKVIFDEIQALTEDILTEDGTSSLGKNWYITGPFIECEVKNRNGRKYPMYIMEREVARYNKDFISQRRAIGEMSHPQGPTINLDRASHLFTDLHKEGNTFYGKAKILEDQEHGRKVAGFLKEGIKLGISTRGMGSLRNINGVDEVQNDYFLATAGDIVLDPSAPHAFVQGIYENREWIYSGGTLVECFLEHTKKELDKKLDEQKILDSFNKFMKLI